MLRLNLKIPFLIMIIIFLPSLASAARKDGTIIEKKIISRDENIIEEQIIYLSDELKVRGKLFYQENTQNKLPALIFCHDGVNGITPSTIRRCRQLTQAGYVVFAPSYRGEDGSEGKIEVAKGEVNDVLNALKMIKNIEFIDHEKMGLIGTSHGALISMLALTKTQEIKAAVIGYGVMDIYSWYWYLTRKYGFKPKDPLSIRIYGRGPKDEPKAFAQRYALNKIKYINCPLLIIHGKKDKTVPLEQSYKLMRKLKKLKKPYQVFIVPSSGHGFLIYSWDAKEDKMEEIKEADLAWEKTLRFLKQYL